MSSRGPGRRIAGDALHGQGAIAERLRGDGKSGKWFVGRVNRKSGKAIASGTFRWQSGQAHASRRGSAWRRDEELSEQGDRRDSESFRADGEISCFVAAGQVPCARADGVGARSLPQYHGADDDADADAHRLTGDADVCAGAAEL